MRQLATTSGGIAKKDADQLRGSVQWNTDKNPDAAGVPVMLHPADVLDEKAIAVPGMRVITPAKLTDLKTAVEGFTSALAQGHHSWAAEQAVAQQLATYRLTGDRIIATFSVTARRPA